MIVVAGDALIDMIMTLDGQFHPVAGGGQYNTARTMGRLGADVSFLGRLSDDWFGRLLRSGLEEAGVHTDDVVETTDPSTLGLAEIDAAGVAHYRFYLQGTSVPGLQVEQALRVLERPLRAIHAGTLGLSMPPAADALAALVEAAPDDTLVMVDPNCRPSTVPQFEPFQTRMRRVLGRADIVKASTEDLEYLDLAGSIDASVASILSGRANVVIVTDGADPVRVFWRGEHFDMPVEPVEVVDTIGAGDAFGGGFLARWLELGLGREDLADEALLRDAVRFGMRVSAIVCQRAGADPPRRAELEPSG